MFVKIISLYFVSLKKIREKGKEFSKLCLGKYNYFLHIIIYIINFFFFGGGGWILKSEYFTFFSLFIISEE